MHLSKTGGTFVEETVRALHCPSAFGRRLHRYRKKYGLKLPFYRYGYREIGDQHGLCSDLPESERQRTILSIIRNPFDLYVSEYTFKWWIKYAHLWFDDLAAIEKAYPDWQTFSFEQFLEVSNQHATWVQRTLKKHPQTACLGWYSHKFVYYFCQEHDYVFAAAGDPEEFYHRVREKMFPVHFIHTERLNQDLHAFLLAHGYDRSRIQHIPAKEKVNTSRKDYNWRKWYSEEMRSRVEQRDALIFRLFPEYQLPRERAPLIQTPTS